MWPTSGTQIQNPELDCLDRRRLLRIPDLASNKQRGHGRIGQRCVGLQRKEVIADLCFFLGGFMIIQFIRHPIPVQEVKSVVMGRLRGASFYTL